jgi:hypothetical protein
MTYDDDDRFMLCYVCYASDDCSMMERDGPTGERFLKFCPSIISRQAPIITRTANTTISCLMKPFIIIIIIICFRTFDRS